MQLIPIETRTLKPPKDDLFSVLAESLPELREGDIVLITSKVVSIHQGRCVEIGSIEKSELVRKEADRILEVPGRVHPMTLKHHALISAAGIDESNGDGYYTLLPEKPFTAARELWKHIRSLRKIDRLGLIITDSHSLPFRYGAMSIAIAFWGMHPLESHIGKQDIFGRVIRHSRTNLVDSLAASATLVSGECAERRPIVIARDVPGIRYTAEDTRDELLIPREDDLYGYLYREFF